MFILDADDRLSHEMEQRAVLTGPEVSNSGGCTRAAKKRCVTSGPSKC